MKFKEFIAKPLTLPLFISTLFFIAYAILGIVRQLHFWSGYDLAIADQAIWKYAHFMAPISTNHSYAFTSILSDHVEFIFPLLVPFYWIYDNVKILIVLQALAISSSGIAIYLLAKKKKIKTFLAVALTISYLSFYGIQNAIWADVHSLVFGISFLAWFIYFVETDRLKLSWLFFMLAILSKEDMALLTFFISGLMFWQNRQKKQLIFVAISGLYLFAIFFIYFPCFVPGGYRYAQSGGLLAHIDVSTFANTKSKQDVLFYSSLWFGFLPFLNPLFLLPALFDLLKYFVVANSVVTSGQGLFGHYRSSLALLFVWPTILSIAKYKKLNNIYVAFYLLFFALVVQYQLHLPLSYFAKKWFWTQPTSVTSITQMLTKIPPQASVATQVNILPHLSHRKTEFVLWPTTKDFADNSPCGKKNCLWFRIAARPEYILVDTSTDWDIRYWLTDRNTFIQTLQTMEKAGVIAKKESIGTTTLYTVLKNP